MNDVNVPDFIHLQNAFASHLRDPLKYPAPADIEDRRMQIYRDLFYNNIEGFLSKGFPVLRKITEDKKWHALVRDFFATHSCKTPYFHQICREFLDYLENVRSNQEVSKDDPVFMLELAHYEWVELALDINENAPQFPSDLGKSQGEVSDVLDAQLNVSPLAWVQAYQYPVHKIRLDFQPEEPSEQPIFLVVYRNREDSVKFIEVNAFTAGLLELLQQEDIFSAREALNLLAEQVNQPVDNLLPFAVDLIKKFRSLDVLL